MLVSSHSVEIERIYQDVCLAGARSIAFSGVEEGDGSTFMAESLVQRVLLSGHSALLVDMNTFNPNLQHEISFAESQNDDNLLPSPTLVSNKVRDKSFVGVLAPNQRPSILKLRREGVLEALTKQWLAEYDFVVFDTSALMQANQHNIPAELVCSVVEACYLVVKSGVTRQHNVKQAVEVLHGCRANLRGAILNDQCNPSLKSELMRECRRIEPWLGGISRIFARLIQSSRFLSVDL